jgi:uncharacterized phage protein (TIGR01671 family)
MREIKFRVWDGEEIQYPEFFIFNRDWNYSTNWSAFHGKGMKERVTANQEQLMQFTGLLDKNGKEIYESDIYRIKDKIFTVVFENGAFVLNNKSESNLHRVYNAIHNGEIIGNIYDNPELL